MNSRHCFCQQEYLSEYSEHTMRGRVRHTRELCEEWAQCEVTGLRLGVLMRCEGYVDHGERHYTSEMSWQEGQTPCRHLMHHSRGPGTSDEQHNMISAAEMLEACEYNMYAAQQMQEAADRIERALANHQHANPELPKIETPTPKTYWR